MESFQCRTVDAIYFGKGKKPWIPQTKVVDDKKFICIHKGERRKDKPSNTGNFGVLDEIKKLRYETCNARMQAIIAEASADLPDDPKARKQKQKQTARDSDHVIGGAWIPLTMPPKEGIAGHTMNVIWSVTSPQIWMEYTIENLEYLRAVLRSPVASKGRSRPAKGQGCGRAKKSRNAKSKADEAAEPVEPVESAEDFNSMDAPAEDAQSAQLANPNFPGDHASAEEPHA
ncbi:unnamed protein product [Cladocopium goreaui]|uniref:Uncharacterized protein n=1 Tax=Cladocopium goreaui TaxID=2562237 RepID=A0A9P1D2L9_9DINO|nr:unnamed protein product [Cladocopium goreaui]